MPNLNINIPDADETTKGIAEVATQAEVDAGTDDTRIVTPNKLENSAIRAEVTANNAKVTNATHTGQVTGSGALTVDKTAITDQSAGTVASGDLVLISDIDDSNNLKKVTAQSIADLGGGGSNTVYVQYISVTNTALADDADYFVGVGTTIGSNANQTVQVELPTCTIKSAHITTYNGSTVGSSETGTFYLYSNDGADNDVISSSITFDGNRSTGFSITGLSISITGGLSWIQFRTPTFVTNPNAARVLVLLELEL